MNTVIYIRVSTREQNDSHLGIEAQRKLCTEVAEKLGLIVLETFVEVCTGTKAPLDRAKFAEAHELALRVRGSLLVAKIDRLSRNFSHAVSYLENDCFPRVIVADNPSMSRLELRLRAVFAAEERDLISQRTKDALAVKRSQGYEFGRESAKAKHNKAAEANKASLERAKYLRNRHGYSLEKVAIALNTEGYCNSTGGKWTAPLLSHWLRKETHHSSFASSQPT